MTEEQFESLLHTLYTLSESFADTAAAIRAQTELLESLTAPRGYDKNSRMWIVEDNQA
jgi:hypothetical protein